MHRRFLSSLVAGSLALIVSYLERISIGGAFLPELGSQTFFSYAPSSVESIATESLGALAKYTTFAAAIILTLMIYGAIGLYLFRLFDKLGTESPSIETVLASTISYVILLIIGGILLMLILVTGQPTSLGELAVSLIPPQLAFGFLNFIVILC